MVLKSTGVQDRRAVSSLRVENVPGPLTINGSAHDPIGQVGHGVKCRALSDLFVFEPGLAQTGSELQSFHPMSLHIKMLHDF